MCKCGNIAAAPLFTHYYKQKTAEKQVIGGKSAVDKGKFFCGRRWSQIVELSTVFPFPSPARAEELPRSSRRRADLGELSRKPPKLSTKSNIYTALFAEKTARSAPPGWRKRPFAPLRAEKEGGLCPPPGQNALPAAGKCLADSKRNARGRAMFPPVLAEKYAGGGENAAGRAARFPFDPPQGKVWRAAGDRRGCPALSSPFPCFARERCADGGRFCRFACPTPPHMV